MFGGTEWQERGRLMRFFAEHGRCGHGFDLRHPGGPGSGNLRARCRGCGAEVSYSAGAKETDFVEPAPEAAGSATREAGAFAARDAGPRLPRPTLPSAPTLRRRPKTESPPPVPEPIALAAEGGRPVRRAWRSPFATAAITCLAVASATFAAVRLSNENGTVTPGNGGSTQPALSAPAATEPTVAAPTVATPTVAAPTVAEPPAAHSAKAKGGGAPGKRQSVAAGGPSISLPGDWERRIQDQAVVFSPKGSSDTEVRVYFQRGASISATTFRSQTRALLEKEHPGAKITTEGPLISASRGSSLVATYGGGFERAQGVVENGTVVLVFARADKAAKPALQGKVLKIAASVRG